MTAPSVYLRTFILLLIIVSVAFAWVLLPFVGAIFWGAILAVIFMPVNQWMLNRMGGRRNLAALTTLFIIVLMVIIPVAITTASLIQEGMEVYKRIDEGKFRLGAYFEQVLQAMPSFVHDILNRTGLGDAASIREKISSSAMEASKFVAKRAVSFGQNTAGFLIGLVVMLYLVFFLLRDGIALVEKSRELIPLSRRHQQHLTYKFSTVVKATVKGNIAVAAIQGALGGLIFWILDIQGVLLWSVIMAVLSLLPAVGASLIWGPVAIYFFATGALWQGIVLTVFGILVIGLADNVLRPVLVGKDTKLPDYVVLISTLGGLSVFGLNGFVIGPLLAALFVACWDLFPSALDMDNKP